MSKYIFYYLFWVCIFLQAKPVFSQLKTYSFDQIDSLQKVEKRNVIVFIYTDWCKYCQTMKNTTFKDKEITKLLNEDFLFANLNAEEKQDILFNGHTFKYKPTGTNTGIHELAEQLATIDKQVAYPTLCFLNSNYEIIFQYNQFINATDLSNLLTRLK
jgi:thioredoxin-related protein